MRIQFEEIDLLRPWPELRLAEGYHAMRVLVRLGTIPVDEVVVRPARRRIVTPRRLKRRMAKKIGWPIVRAVAREVVRAGPEAMTALPAGAGDALKTLTLASRRRFQRIVPELFLDEKGMPSPWRELVEQAQQQACDHPLPPVTVAVCTRDRPEQIEQCIRHLLELDYPEFEILVVDNSSKERSPATREVIERLGVSYTREPVAGLSRARNAALVAARNRWVAFTDDDCRPERNWLRELVRKLQDNNCRCVCGLVLPAQLENAAEIVFELYGGLGRGYVDVAYPPDYLRKERLVPAKTWRIGAGANMLLDADLVHDVGGYDTDMGPGSVGGCGEDTDIFYQILRRGHSIHYTPRAIVHHYHRSSPEALRKQIYSYAIGHAAYHVRCIFAYGDYRSLLHLCWFLPKWMLRNYRRAMRNKTRYPRSLIPMEARGTVRGVVQYTAVKIKRLAGALVGRRAWPRLAARVHGNGDEAEQRLMSYGTVTVKKPVRAA